jgi:hypothetical protein
MAGGFEKRRVNGWLRHGDGRKNEERGAKVATVIGLTSEILRFAQDDIAP